MNKTKIKVGGKTYTINFEEDLTEKFGITGDDEVYGCIDYANSNIYVDTNMSEDSIQESLVHEILHALLDRRNLELIGKNSTIPEMVENIVEYLTPRFHAFLVDNPNFQKEILNNLRKNK